MAGRRLLLAAALVAGFFGLGGGAGGGADHDRLRHGADRRARRRRQDGAARDADLAGRRQRQGRAAGPAGQARLLRRPEQPADGAGDLHQAARCRQGRHHRLGLRHQHDRAGDAGRDPARPAVSRAVRARGQQRVPLPEILLDAADRARPEARLFASLFQGRDGQGAQAEDARDRRRRRRIPAKTPRKAPATPPSQLGLKIVYDKSYPPSTADYSPIVHAVQATNPEIVFVASYPPDSVGMVRAATEIGLKTRYFGGGMVGLQFTSIKQQLGPEAQRHPRLRLVDPERRRCSFPASWSS